ncbi:MAG: site-specific integrase [Lachnospiraceae bacterium]|nr:site-specific integrase [Lachnospiraceae bacterium]
MESYIYLLAIRVENTPSFHGNGLKMINARFSNSDNSCDTSKNLMSALNEIHAITKENLLKQAESGEITYEEVGRQIDIMKKDNDYLGKHTYEIWYNNKTDYWYTYLPGQNGRRQIKSRKKSGLIQKIIKFYKEEEKKLYFRDAFYEWLDRKIRYKEITESSYTKYENTYKRFFKHDDPFCMTILADMNDDIVEEFIRRTIADNNLTKKAYSDFRIVLKGTLSYAKKEKYTTYSISSFLLDLDLSDRIFNVKEPKRDEEEVFSVEEEKKLLDYLWHHSDVIENLGLILALETGVRVGELATLHWSDVLSEDEIRISSTETVYRDRETHDRVIAEGEKPKTAAGYRYIILPESSAQTLNAIRALNPRGKYVFARKDSPNKFVSARMFNYYLHKACEAVGIPPRSTHKMRKTYATALAEQNVDERTILKQMGHTNIAVTKSAYIRNRKNKEYTKALISDARSVNVSASKDSKAIKGNQT